MARFGIGYQVVAEIAQQLQAGGVNPTVESIRRKTGTGSNGTIAMHLRTWREKKDEIKRIASKEDLPEHLVAMVKELWNRIHRDAQEKIDAMKKEVANEILELKTRLQQLAADNAHWEQQFHALQQEKEQLANNNLGLEQAIIELKKQNALLESKIDALIQQIEDKQSHINELNRLHKQVQRNLEHYQESTREQRLLEQQRFEEQQHQSMKTIYQLEQKLMAHRQDYTVLNEKLNQASREKEMTQKSNDALQSQLDKMQMQVTQIEKELAEKIQRKSQLQVRSQSLQEKLNERIAIGNEYEKQIAVLSAQLSTTQNEATALTAQNKSLAHEKWLLGQEKAHLEGQLKQLGVLLEKQAATT